MASLVIALISHLKYLGIFIGTFVEGPTIGLLAGFLVKIGFLNLFLVYLSHVLGDLTADFFYYFVGYHGQKKFLERINISEKNIIKAEKIKKIFHQHPQKIIILGKLTHIIGLPILLGVGMSRYNWRKFLLFDFLATIIKSALLISVGYYLAESWTKANDFISHLSWFGLLFLLAIIICFVMKKLVKNLWKN